MQIIIPMTGNGSRFKQLGYKDLKPLIEVQGKPMIEWVVKMFPGDEKNIIFLCRKEHLESIDNMQSILNNIAPGATIYSIDHWQKKGPVNDVMNAEDIINDNEPVIVSYCDYYMQWNYNKFKADVTKSKCEGAIPCYSGFHPHLIYKDNLYASCKIDSDNNLIEIKEKYSWEKDKQQSLHSPGVYYFKSGALLKHYYQKLLESDNQINGEYYSSLPYNYMVEDGKKVWCPLNVGRFCQWGTPKDLEESRYWLDKINNWK